MHVGLSYRLMQELEDLPDVRLVPHHIGRERGYNSQRKVASWVGGSLFASLPTFGTLVITKQEWEETGESILHKKCF